MWDKIKSLGEQAKDAINTTAVLVGDLNGDGKVDDEDARIAAEWAKKTATSAGNEASRITIDALHSDMARDAAAGAAVGAAIALPVPFIGPMAGAAIGAGVGVYKNLTKKDSPAHTSHVESKIPIDFHDQLIKLDDLRKKGIISEDEFETQKKRVLDNRN